MTLLVIMDDSTKFNGFRVLPPNQEVHVPRIIVIFWGSGLHLSKVQRTCLQLCILRTVPFLMCISPNHLEVHVEVSTESTRLIVKAARLSSSSGRHSFLVSSSTHWIWHRGGLSNLRIRLKHWHRTCSGCEESDNLDSKVIDWRDFMLRSEPVQRGERGREGGRDKKWVAEISWFSSSALCFLLQFLQCRILKLRGQLAHFAHNNRAPTPCTVQSSTTNRLIIAKRAYTCLQTQIAFCFWELSTPDHMQWFLEGPGAKASVWLVAAHCPIDWRPPGGSCQCTRHFPFKPESSVLPFIEITVNGI